jgi:hypothetical protein
MIATCECSFLSTENPLARRHRGRIGMLAYYPHEI